MKKLTALLFAAALAMAFTANPSPVQAAGSEFAIKVDDRNVGFDVAPAIINSRLMVPFRVIGSEMNADISWDGDAKKVTMSLNRKFVEVTIGSDTMYCGEMKWSGDKFVPDRSTLKPQQLDAAAIIIGGRTLVPLRAIADGLGADVWYADATKTASIVSPPVEVTQIKLTISRNSYIVGQRGKIRVDVYPENAVDKSFGMEPSGAGIVSIISEKEFECVGPGEEIVTVKAASGAALRFRVHSIDLDDYRDEVVRLVNAERGARGLNALSSGNEQLNQASQLRAEESAQQFSHTRPNGSSCFTALDEAGASYLMCGENIAKGQITPEQVVRGWMESEGHRNNILHTDFNYIGVGAYVDDDFRFTWSQMFIGA